MPTQIPSLWSRQLGKSNFSSLIFVYSSIQTAIVEIVFVIAEIFIASLRIVNMILLLQLFDRHLKPKKVFLRSTLFASHELLNAFMDFFS